jgi:RND superfamily putative drug exporter
MMRTTTRWVLAHRRLVAGFWLLVVIAGIAFSGSATNALQQSFAVPDREGSTTNQAIESVFGTGGGNTPLVAVATLPPGTSRDDPAVDRSVDALAGKLRGAVPGTRVAADPQLGSRDGRTVVVVADQPVRRGAFGPEPESLDAARAAVRGATIAGAPVHLTGMDLLSDEAGGGDGGGGPGVLLESLIGGLGALAVLAFVFASLLAFVPLIVAVVSIMGSFLLVWPLAEVTDVSPIVAFLIALIGLGVAIDYSLLVVVRWREERERHGDGDEAIVAAMATAGRTVVFSGTTVAIGLLAIVALPLPFLRSIGFAGMLIPLVSTVVTVTLLPVILRWAGPRLDWPHVRREDRASRAWTRWAQAVVRHRVAATIVAVTLLAGLVVGATTLQFGAFNGEPDALAKQSNGQATAGLRALQDAGMGEGVLTPIQVLVRGGDPDAVAAKLAQVPGVYAAAAPADWRRGGLAVVDVLPRAEVSEAAGRATLDRVRDAAHAAGPRATVGGNGAQQRDFVDAVYGSFPLMIALIAIITFVLLARAFRSLLLPLKAIVLNVVSVAAAWGAVVLVWQHGYGSDELWGIAATGTLPPWIPLMIFAFLFGLSMDYEVFILARMREEYDRTGDTDEAVVVGLGRTGRLVTSAALILFLTFVSMGSGPDMDVKMLATGLAAGILLDATLIRALLVPAVVSLFGRWNWWLPRPAARVLRVRTTTSTQGETA